MIRGLIELLVRRIWFAGQSKLTLFHSQLACNEMQASARTSAFFIFRFRTFAGKVALSSESLKRGQKNAIRLVLILVVVTLLLNISYVI